MVALLFTGLLSALPCQSRRFSLSAAASPAKCGGAVAPALQAAPSLLALLDAQIVRRQQVSPAANLERHPPDLLIRSSLGSIRFMDFDRAGEITELGYQAANSALLEWQELR